MPANNIFKEDIQVDALKNKQDIENKIKVNDKTLSLDLKNQYSNVGVLNEVEIILSKNNNQKITTNLINSFELSLYKKQIENIQLNINRYSNKNELINILENKAIPGKIFIGTLSSKESAIVKNYCSKKIIFFSFASDKNLAGDCVYLINFFPEDDIIALFNFFPDESKVALLYPENYYGYNINEIIDSIALKSKSIIISRASYKEDLSNAREAIKRLGKYDLRKNELKRQKKILTDKNDDVSKKALKKIEKFETLGNVDFTHLILPDYSIRLLEIAPLLPFYDVDPNKVRFVGTGVWDESIFFDEPSLQGGIFPGIEEQKRKDFFNDFYHIYKEKPIRTATIPYDLIGIISHIVNKKMNLLDTYNLLDNGNIKFDGIDGKFYFKKHIIFRELNILQIKNGVVKKIN